MTDKEYYLTGYGFILGTNEAENAWKEKCIFMIRTWPDHNDIEMYRSYIDIDFIDQKRNSSAMVMGDIQPYISQIDGSLIESRSKHRAHLKANNCIEIGNETKHMKPKPMTPPPGLKQQLIEVANEKLRYK